jgi:hypothetical protein
MNVRIKMIVLLVRKSGTLQLGQELELPDEDAIEMVHQGYAEVLAYPPGQVINTPAIPASDALGLPRRRVKAEKENDHAKL